jgi:hypothetical protein
MLTQSVDCQLLGFSPVAFVMQVRAGHAPIPLFAVEQGFK